MTLQEGYVLLGGNLMETLSRLGSQTLLMKHLRRFPEDGAMTALRDAACARDMAGVWRAAHALRGTCRTLGLSGLAEAVGQFMAAPEAARALLEREYARAVAVIGFVSDAVESATETVEMPRSFDGLRALLAEDDRLCAETSAELLAGLGLSTRVARDSEEAVRLAGQGGFDCVFLDAHMPGMDGPSALRGIRRALPDAPVFVLTAGLLPGEEERLRAEGLRECLIKPVGADRLARLLSACFPDR